MIKIYDMHSAVISPLIIHNNVGGGVVIIVVMNFFIFYYHQKEIRMGKVLRLEIKRETNVLATASVINDKFATSLMEVRVTYNYCLVSCVM